MVIEASFGCNIPDEEAGKILKVSDAVQLCKSTLAYNTATKIKRWMSMTLRRVVMTGVVAIT